MGGHRKGPSAAGGDHWPRDTERRIRDHVGMSVSRRPSPVESMAFRAFVALCGLTLAGLLVFGVVLSGSPSTSAPSSAAAMVEVAPGGVVDPAEVPESVAVLYRAAHAHSDIYENVPCFCGCEEMLGHRHLLDCFARPNGGWEAHALGCGVCLGEAQQVEELLADGVDDPDRIREAVVARWGDPYQ